METGIFRILIITIIALCIIAAVVWFAFFQPAKQPAQDTKFVYSEREKNVA